MPKTVMGTKGVRGSSNRVTVITEPSQQKLVKCVNKYLFTNNCGVIIFVKVI